MSNLTNDIIEEQLWETLKELFDDDANFAGKVCEAAMKNTPCGKDDYHHNGWEHLSTLANEIMDNCAEQIPICIDDVEDAALIVMGA